MLTLSVLPETLAICRLSADAPLPEWAKTDGFVSITRTPNELSIVCVDHAVPNNVQCDQGWRGLKVDGPLDLSLTGILASIANPLADAGINLFAISTFDTDYVLVKAERLSQAVEVLKQAGHQWREP